MNVLVVVANPNPASFCHALAGVAVSALKDAGHAAVFHDLYAEKFDPVLGPDELAGDCLLSPVVQKHCGEVSSADGIIVIHPNWWGQPPAILKGWMDRVFRQGTAYEFSQGDNGEGVPRGLLKATAAVILNTSNTPLEREQAEFGDPLEAIWKNCIFRFCGVNAFRRRTYSAVVSSTPEQRAEWLADAAGIVSEIFSPRI